MKQKLKTKTLGYEDNPIVSYVEGHISPAEFNAAFCNEGWHGDPINDLDIKQTYWKLTKKRYKKVEKGTKGAIAVTVSYW